MPRRRVSVRLPHIDPYFTFGLIAVLTIGIVKIWSSRSTELRKLPSATMLAADNAKLSHRIGNEGAPIVVTEIGDFQCVACAQAHALLWPRIQDLVRKGAIKYVAYDLPFRPIAPSETIAADCVGEIDANAYWLTRNELYHRGNAISSSPSPDHTLMEIVAGTGTDSVQVRSCIRRTGFARLKEFQELLRSATDEGLSYTPVWAVNGKIAPWSKIPEALDRALASNVQTTR